MDHFDFGDAAIEFLLQSHRTHFQYEYNYALGFDHKTKNKTIIPVLIEDVEPPDLLRNIVYFKYNTENAVKSAEELVTMIGRSIANKNAERVIKSRQIEKVEKNLADYIQKSLNDLEKKEKTFRRISYILYLFSFVSLLLAAIFAFINSKDLFPISENIFQQMALIISTLVVSSLLIALSKFTFTLGKSFMVESLRNSNRIHAISFGELYLNIYGEEIEWSEFKEAFQHWNIDMGSTFSSQNAKEYDPELLKRLTEISNVLKVK